MPSRKVWLSDIDDFIYVIGIEEETSTSPPQTGPSEVPEEFPTAWFFGPRIDVNYNYIQTTNPAAVWQQTSSTFEFSPSYCLYTLVDLYDPELDTTVDPNETRLDIFGSNCARALPVYLFTDPMVLLEQDPFGDGSEIALYTVVEGEGVVDAYEQYQSSVSPIILKDRGLHGDAAYIPHALVSTAATPGDPSALLIEYSVFDTSEYGFNSAETKGETVKAVIGRGYRHAPSVSCTVHADLFNEIAGTAALASSGKYTLSILSSNNAETLFITTDIVTNTSNGSFLLVTSPCISRQNICDSTQNIVQKVAYNKAPLPLPIVIPDSTCWGRWNTATNTLEPFTISFWYQLFGDEPALPLFTLNAVLLEQTGSNDAKVHIFPILGLSYSLPGEDVLTGRTTNNTMSTFTGYLSLMYAKGYDSNSNFLGDVVWQTVTTQYPILTHVGLAGGWINTTLSWDGTVFKVYMNGSCVLTVDTTSIPFVLPTGDETQTHVAAIYPVILGEAHDSYTVYDVSSDFFTTYTPSDREFLHPHVYFNDTYSSVAVGEREYKWSSALFSSARVFNRAITDEEVAALFKQDGGDVVYPDAHEEVFDYFTCIKKTPEGYTVSTTAHFSGASDPQFDSQFTSYAEVGLPHPISAKIALTAADSASATPVRLGDFPQASDSDRTQRLLCITSVSITKDSSTVNLHTGYGSIHLGLYDASDSSLAEEVIYRTAYAYTVPASINAFFLEEVQSSTFINITADYSGDSDGGSIVYYFAAAAVVLHADERVTQVFFSGGYSKLGVVMVDPYEPSASGGGGGGSY